MTQTVKNEVLLETEACALAFRAGQLVEKYLLEAGYKQAICDGVSRVTAETVESCVTNSLVEYLEIHLHLLTGQEVIDESTGKELRRAA